MGSFRRNIGIAASTLALLCAAPAFAQGGPAGGGGGLGGGGGGGGGATPPPPPAASCATITSFSNTTGYYSVFAAIWTPFGVSNSCNGTVSWRMIYTNANTGAVDFVRSGSTYYATASGTVDEDWAAFSTSYTVTLSVTDAAGVTLDSRSAVVTTKAGKTPGA